MNKLNMVNIRTEVRTMQVAVFIYGLKDPRTDKVRYVGQSALPGRRYQKHLTNLISSPNSPKTLWVKELRSLDLKPELVILEIAFTSTACEIEKKWQEIYWSGDITNVNIGGPGNRQYDNYNARNLLQGKLLTFKEAAAKYKVTEKMLQDIIIQRGYMVFGEPGSTELLVSQYQLNLGCRLRLPIPK